MGGYLICDANIPILLSFKCGWQSYKELKKISQRLYLSKMKHKREKRNA